MRSLNKETPADMRFWGGGGAALLMLLLGRCCCPSPDRKGRTEPGVRAPERERVSVGDREQEPGLRALESELKTVSAVFT